MMETSDVKFDHLTGPLSQQTSFTVNATLLQSEELFGILFGPRRAALCRFY